MWSLVKVISVIFITTDFILSSYFTGKTVCIKTMDIKKTAQKAIFLDKEFLYIIMTDQEMYYVILTF